ncbi:MAG: metalloregulator ArsR/SmtB family transcription factor [bacterium]
MSKIDQQAYSKYFKAFGDPSRLKILSILAIGDKTVGEIVAKMELSQPTVSRHLAVLREAGILSSRREGQQVIYGLNRESVRGCCEGFCMSICIPTGQKKKTK